MRPTPAECALLTHAAERAYVKGVTQPKLSLAGWTVVGYLTARDAVFFGGDRVYYGFVAVSVADPQQYVAVVRGTENATEWAIDAKFLLIDHPIRGRVEHGFYSTYASMDFEHVDGKVGMIAHVGLGALARGAKLEVTGHSLGAAMATYLAVDVAADGKCDVSATMIASPKPGDIEFARYADSMIKAYQVFTSDDDVVPDLPPSGLLALIGRGYKHLPQRTRLSSLYSHAEIEPGEVCAHSAVSYAAMLDPDINLPVPNCVKERS